jgi:hypothetical protein
MATNGGDPYASFLLRCWTLDGRPHRIQVEHVQSGTHVQVSSLEAALQWLRLQWAAVDTQQAADASEQASLLSPPGIQQDILTP